MSLAKYLASPVLLIACWLPDCGAEPAQQSGNPGSPWPATDELGRELPTASDVGPPIFDRFVGMFYFLTHNQNAAPDQNAPGPRDVSRILAADPHALLKPE